MVIARSIENVAGDAAIGWIDKMRKQFTGEDRPLLDIEYDSYSEIRKMVEISDCVGGIPETCMRYFFEAGLFKKLPCYLPGITAISAISCLKGIILLPAAEYLIAELKALEGHNLEKALEA